MEEQETHFSLINMKSQMCHPILSTIQCIASADSIYISPVHAPWHPSLSGIEDIIYRMCRLLSSYQTVTKTVIACLTTSILRGPLPWFERANQLGRSLIRGEYTATCFTFSTAILDEMLLFDTELSISKIAFICIYFTGISFISLCHSHWTFWTLYTTACMVNQ